MRLLLRRVWYLIQRRRLEADLAEEMACHRELAEHDLEKRGVPPSEASLAARKAFGSEPLAQNQARDVWIWPWVQDAANDLRLAVRLLHQDVGFTVVAVLVLGAGIGISNTQFTLLNAICLRGLPIERPDRVLSVGARDARDRRLGLSFREFQELRSSVAAFAGVAASVDTPVAVGDVDRAPDRAISTYISTEAFALLHVRPLLGRDFDPADDRPGAQPVAILSSGLWKARYGGDPSVVGRAIRINGTPTLVVGIARERFEFPSATDVWQPLALMTGLTTDRRTARALTVFGRLTDGATRADAVGQVGTIAARLEHDFPDTNQGIRLTVLPINDYYNADITNPAWLAFIAVAVVVLLIACANAANLLLMRAVGRSHEMAIRAALGASRGRLVRQLLIESAVLAGVGGLVGAAFSMAGARLMWTFVPPKTLPFWMTFTMDGLGLAVLSLMTLSTVFVFGLVPAIHIGRTDVHHLLKDGGRTGTSGVRARRWTTVFLTLEFGLTTILISALVIGHRQTRAQVQADLVIDPSNLVTTWVTLPPNKYKTADERFAFLTRLGERLGTAPDVKSSAVATTLPLGGAAARLLSTEGAPPASGGAAPTVWTVTVSPAYFDVLSLRLARGRPFGDRDGAAGSETAIVNRRFAQMFFDGGDPVGRRIRLMEATAPGASAPWLTIVGEAPTVRQRGVPNPDPIVYLPIRAAPPATAAVVVRAGTSAAAIAPALRDIVRGIDSDLPLYGIMSLDDAMARSQWNGRMSTILLDTIAAVALLLATVGLYAVTAHAVGQRAREIGIRMALGARTPQVVWIVLRKAMAQLALGLLVGFFGTMLWSQAFSGTGVAPSTGPRFDDPLTLASVTAMLVAVTGLAAAWPALCASRIDPAVVLRSE
jgi:putative ABC transport system permease protein